MEKLLNDFIEFVKIDTQSDYDSEKNPSTEKQLILANLLKEKLEIMNLENIVLDEKGYVYALLPSNSSKTITPIGFISHMDTSPDYSGKNVKPIIHDNYDGTDIVLHGGTVISISEFPELKKYLGKTLITSDGTTLLGADDKAGIAEIFSALEYFVSNPTLEHGDVFICFTPDEEVGRGADHFNTDIFKAEFAYTVDGGELGELEFENFNAARADITIDGRNVHPGTAKNKMINSLEIALKLDNMLPQSKRPQYTEGREGFFHMNDLYGSVEEARMTYIIRDHDKVLFENKKQLFKDAVNYLNEELNEERIHLQLKDQYYNMYEKIKPNMHIVDIASHAMEKAGVTPLIKPIRGGTDGARISFMGIPCPNIFTGGHNFHGRYEFICLESMQKAVEVITNIVTNKKLVK